MAPSTAAAAPTTTMQGFVVPQASVNPAAFAELTRRNNIPIYNTAFKGLGATDDIPIRKAGVLSELMIQAVGNVVVVLNAGTCATTSRWPYDLIRGARFSANGMSQLINVSGLKLKVYEIAKKGDFNDRGVVQAIGGASPGTARSQGTLAMDTEAWGLGSAVSAVAAATYNFDLEWIVPVAQDNVTLSGAIFAQTSSTDLVLSIDWALPGDIFVLTGAATAVMTCTIKVVATTFSIPNDGRGGIFIPDLSAFHTLQQTRYNAASGINEITLVGQGAGRQLLRLFTQAWVSGAPATILLPTDANIGQYGFRYGTNDTPESFPSGSFAAKVQERKWSSDPSAFWGFLSHDFINEFGYRDAYDEGTASEMRMVIELLGNPVTPVIEYVQETLASGVTV